LARIVLSFPRGKISNNSANYVTPALHIGKVLYAVSTAIIKNARGKRAIGLLLGQSFA